MVDRCSVIQVGQALSEAGERFGVVWLVVENGAKETLRFAAVVLTLADARDCQHGLYRTWVLCCKLFPVPGCCIRIGVSLQACQQAQRAVLGAL